MTLKEYLTNFRKNQGLTQSEMAVQMHIAFSQYNGLETGRVINPSGATLKKISVATGTSITKLRQMIKMEEKDEGNK